MQKRRWDVGRKQILGLSYLQVPDAGQAQVVALNRGCDGHVAGPAAPGPGSCHRLGAAGLLLQDVPAGSLDLLVRCSSCPLDSTRKFRVDVKDETGAWQEAASEPVDIRPLKEWMTVYTVHQPGTQRPKAEFTPLDSYGWRRIPDTATKLTVLVHGYAVGEESAQSSFVPITFKRLYWAGHPVLDRQTEPEYVVGMAWPGDTGLLPQIFYVTDEYRALQSGVPLAGFFVEQHGEGRRINVISHSLGGMVVNSALLQVPPQTVHAFAVIGYRV